jgi:pSer/pThr/pTyr-binding forkhead associated (FHA) protein
MGGDKTVIQSAGGGDSKYLPQDMFMSMEVIEGPDQGMVVNLTQTRTVLGRGNVDVKLNDPTVSGTHAELEYVNEEEVYIADQKSSNGTFVDGEQVTRALVGNMSEIRLGSTKLLLCMVRDVYGTYMSEGTGLQMQAAAIADPNAVTAPRNPIANPEFPPTLRILLHIVEGPNAGKKLLLRKSSTVIGRGQTVDVQIQDESVSRRHCQIMVSPQGALGIKDLASKNGTFVAGRPINATRINTNDVFAIGDTKIMIIVMQ